MINLYLNCIVILKFIIQRERERKRERERERARVCVFWLTEIFFNCISFCMEFSTFVPKNDSLTCQLPFDTTHTVSLAIVPPTWNAMQTAVSAIARNEFPRPKYLIIPRNFSIYLDWSGQAIVEHIFYGLVSQLSCLQVVVMNKGIHDSLAFQTCFSGDKVLEASFLKEKWGGG